MDVWIQRSLFDEPGVAQPTAIVPTSRHGRARAPRVDRSRVTRDPAVALSHEARAVAASEFRLGLARAFGQLSPEQRQALFGSLQSASTRSAA